MADRFDLEQGILGCWNVVDDMGVLLRMLDNNPTEDEVSNFLIGMRAIYDAKFKELFSTYENLTHSRDI